jgi:hypothetical protein
MPIGTASPWAQIGGSCICRYCGPWVTSVNIGGNLGLAGMGVAGLIAARMRPVASLAAANDGAARPVSADADGSFPVQGKSLLSKVPSSHLTDHPGDPGLGPRTSWLAFSVAAARRAWPGRR